MGRLSHQEVDYLQHIEDTDVEILNEICRTSLSRKEIRDKGCRMRGEVVKHSGKTLKHYKD